MRICSLLLVLATAVGAIALPARATDTNSGRDIAAGCASCHAAQGANGDAIPIIAGRDKVEIAKAMKDFRDGRRPSTVMQQLAKGYTDAQIDAAAAYLAAQKP